MRLHRVEIENFRCFRDRFVLDLLDGEDRPRPLTVLVGPNSSGKTTVLDGIHLAHAAVGNAREPQFRAGLDPSDPTLRPDPNQPIEVELRFSLDEDEWEALLDAEDLLGSSFADIPYADEYGFVLRWPSPEYTEHGICRTDPPYANLAFRGRAVAKLAKARRLTGEAIFDRIGGLLYLDQHRSVRLHGPTTATASEDALREGAGARDVLPWLEYVSRADVHWDPESQGESAWSRVRRLFSELASPASIDRMCAFDEGVDLRFRRGWRTCYSSGMSMGERQLLRLIANLVSQHAARSVVLVDELELHLHPAWQRKLLHFFRSGDRPAQQFLVTTHSESVLRYMDPAAVVSLGPLDSP